MSLKINACKMRANEKGFQVIKLETLVCPVTPQGLEPWTY